MRTVGKLAANCWSYSIRAIAPIVITLTITEGVAAAGMVKIESTVAFKSVMEELGPKFQVDSGIQLAMTFNNVGVVSSRILSGEDFDVAILAPSFIRELTQKGRIVANSTVALAQTGLGIAARSGTSRRALATKADFATFLREVNSIGVIDPSTGAATGLYMAKLLPQLEVSDETKAKVKYFPSGSFPRVLHSNQVDYWVSQLSEIVPTPNVVLVAEFPQEIQQYTVLVGGMSVNSKVPELVQRLFQFIKASESTIKNKGMQTVSTSTLP